MLLFNLFSSFVKQFQGDRVWLPRTNPAQSSEGQPKTPDLDPGSFWSRSLLEPSQFPAVKFVEQPEIMI